MTRWFIKRRPTKKSAFRDLFPYFHEVPFVGEGSFWARTRAEVSGFSSRKEASECLELLRRDDPDLYIVRVTRRKKNP